MIVHTHNPRAGKQRGRVSGLIDYLVSLNQGVSGSVRDPVSENRVEKDEQRHLRLTSGLNTHAYTHSCTPLAPHTYQNITNPHIHNYDSCIA